MNWTDEQLQAISDRGSNILVSAAAGSGKTALLTERLSRLVLEDGVDVTKLLVVTFTRAASREMKERFRKKLYEALDQANRGEPGPMSAQEILRQIGRLDQAQISTMDAFCSRVGAAFESIMDRACAEDREDLTIVAHGGTLMAILSRFARPERDYFAWSTPAGGGHLLTADPADWKTLRKITWRKDLHA